jgi:hypothetical protein
MANYADTVLQNARVKYTERLNNKFEGRPRHTEIIEAFMDSADRTLPDLSALREASTQTTQTLYKKKTAYTVNTAKSCSPTGEQGDSGVVNLTWVTRSVTISIAHERHAGNEYKMAESLSWELEKAEQDLFKGASGSIDAYLLSYLDTNRTQVNAISAAGIGHNTWDVTNFNVDVANADITKFYNYAYDEMMLNDYSGRMLDIFNTTWGAYAREQANQGEANATNTRFQYQMPFDFAGFSSNSITPATGDLSTHYIVPEDGISMVFWNSPSNRQGIAENDFYKDTYQSIFMPGVTLDLYKKIACTDTSASGGSVQDVVDLYELTAQFAVISAPLSTANATPIFKYNILAS